MTKLFVKNMVCNRCILVVRQELEKSGLHPAAVSLGEIELEKAPDARQMALLGERLRTHSFELLDDKKQRLIEKIKNRIIQKIQGGEIEEHFRISEFLSAALHKEYSQITRLFSEVEGTTIEQYFILQKIEKVKEWLVYDELTLSEIAWKLGYSSVAHLSAQFKKVTGLAPSHFKSLGSAQRQSLDSAQRRSLGSAQRRSLDDVG